VVLFDERVYCDSASGHIIEAQKKTDHRAVRSEAVLCAAESPRGAGAGISGVTRAVLAGQSAHSSSRTYGNGPNQALLQRDA